MERVTESVCFLEGEKQRSCCGCERAEKGHETREDFV